MDSTPVGMSAWTDAALLNAAGVPAMVVTRAPADGFALDLVLASLHGALAKGALVHDALHAAAERDPHAGRKAVIADRLFLG